MKRLHPRYRLVTPSTMQLLVALGLSLLAAASAHGVELPQTGQVRCFDAAGEPVACESTGQDGDLEAGARWPVARFTTNGDILLDNLTGLQWTRDAYLNGATVSWQNALNFAANLNVGGFNDWRLPNANELESLINSDADNSGEWLICEGFTGVQNGPNDFYWSSTWRDPAMPDVFVVDMALGTLVPGNTQADLNHVWAVRAGQNGAADPTYPANVWRTGQTLCYDENGQAIGCAGTGQDGDVQAGVAWPVPRFTDNGDGTVTDALTGLMWSRDGNPLVTARMWQAALDDSAAFALAGHTDWRLPNRKELRSLFNYENPLPGGAATPAAWLNLQGFMNVMEDNYWTSSTIVDRPMMAWRSTLADKELAENGKNENHFVWPVRSGTLIAAPDIDVTDSVSPASDQRVPFGAVDVGSSADQTVTVTNDGSLSLDIGTLGAADPLAAPFSLVNDTCSGQLLAPSGSCTVTIRFAPVGIGAYADTFDIPNNDSNENPVIVQLSGTDPSATASRGEVQLAQTGQQLSQRSEDDGDVRAGAAWPSPRFIDNGDGTLTDQLTGLMWTQDANGPGGTRSWLDALSYANGLTTGGHNDWRLPNSLELESLVNAGQTDVATWLSAQGFSGVQSSSYWTSTTDSIFPDEAYTINMSDGDLFRGIKDGDLHSVWSVRGGQTSGNPDPAFPANVWKTGQTICFDEFGSSTSCAGTGQDGEIQAGVTWPSPRFTDNGDGTVTDELTGLMWTQNASPFAISNWQDAVDDAAMLNLAGHDDWRLPNRRELLSLVDASRDSPALPAGHPFTNVQLEFYWSSTTRAVSTSNAWTLAMEEGFVGWQFKNSPDFYAWPVRSPLAPDSDNDGVPDGADCAPQDGSIWQAPGEVLDTLLWSDDKVTLEWECIDFASIYNVYRGTLAGVGGYDHTCFESGDDDASVTESNVPTAGSGWYYLVSGENSCGEGNLGTDHNGAIRPTSTVCP